MAPPFPLPPRGPSTARSNPRRGAGSCPPSGRSVAPTLPTDQGVSDVAQAGSRQPSHALPVPRHLDPLPTHKGDTKGQGWSPEACEWRASAQGGAGRPGTSACARFCSPPGPRQSVLLLSVCITGSGLREGGLPFPSDAQLCLLQTRALAEEMTVKMRL